MTRESFQKSSAFPTPAQVAVAERQRIARAIYEQRAITDVADLREAVLTQMHTASALYALPVEAQLANRQKHLGRFASLFRKMLDSNSPNPQIRAFVRNLHLAKKLGWDLRAFCERPLAYDARFNTPDDLLVLFFQFIFRDQEAGLLPQWMSALDAYVDASSRANLLAIDRVSRARTARPIHKDVVLVGGSALTSLVASILGAYFHVTVITQHGLGRPWRDRPMYINSSSTVRDFNCSPLPLLGGPTTHLIGSQQLNSLQVDALLGSDTLGVPCDDGSRVEYVSGFRLGALIATNIVWHADDYIVGHTVDVAGIRKNADGELRLPLVAEDGTSRELDANALFLLTGPGSERTAVRDAQTQDVYRQMSRQVGVEIGQARQRVNWYQESLQKLEPEAARCWTQVQWLREKRDAQKVVLPRVLTLSSIEELYRHWISNGAEPALFPFTELIEETSDVGYMGAGDTMRTVKELLEKRGPREAYPPHLGESRTRGTIYNERARSVGDYNARNRRRYQGVYTSTTTAIPYKVISYRVVICDGKPIGVAVDCEDAYGIVFPRFHDYLIDATGLNRRPIEASLPDELAARDIRDLQGNIVARGNPDAGLYISGAATQFLATDLPEEFQKIIQILGIPENTISLWVHGALAERNALSFVATHRATKWETEQPSHT